MTGLFWAVFYWEQYSATSGGHYTSGQWCPLNGTIYDKIKHAEMEVHLHSVSANISYSLLQLQTVACGKASRKPSRGFPVGQGARGTPPLGSRLCPDRL